MRIRIGEREKAIEIRNERKRESNTDKNWWTGREKEKILI